ncbi:peptidylprolyl isomerase, partial [Enterocloster asparagiformis]
VQMERNQNQSELEKAAFALEQDEISGIVEENGAFYILKCTNAYDEAATAARKKKLAQEKKNNAFQKIYAPFADSHVVVFDEKMWSEIHFEGGEGSTTTNFFELYHSYFPK